MWLNTETCYLTAILKLREFGKGRTTFQAEKDRATFSGDVSILRIGEDKLISVIVSQTAPGICLSIYVGDKVLAAFYELTELERAVEDLGDLREKILEVAFDEDSLPSKVEELCGRTASYFAPQQREDNMRLSLANSGS